MSTDAPDAKARLRAAFAAGSVELVTERDGRERRSVVAPYALGEGGLRAPFEFTRKRERGEPAGIGEVCGRILDVGWNSIVLLPQHLVDAVRTPPSKEEHGWMLAAARRDPWAAAKLFGVLHAFLLALNLVPLPPLDGFQLVRLALETAARRPLPRRGVVIAQRIGGAVLFVWIALNAVLILRDLAASVL